MSNEYEFAVGLIGCGLIGKKRAAALGSKGKLVACSDIEPKKALALGQEYGAEVISNWRDLVTMDCIDIVIVAAVPAVLPEITKAAIDHGKHVLVEKPAARCAAELTELIKAGCQSSCRVRVGFNHRFHPALAKAKQIVECGELGKLMFIRGLYGHGGRLGYEREWRANPELSGGGELLDQGAHLIDLSRWFLGDFVKISGVAKTYFWDMPVDDNGFMILTTAEEQIAFLQVSCTEWKNTFSFEIYGEFGKLHVSGLGGSYGVEKLTHYRMLPEMGPPETISWEFPMGDKSWSLEIEALYNDIESNQQPSSGLADASATLNVIEEIYRMSNYVNR